MVLPLLCLLMTAGAATAARQSADSPVLVSGTGVNQLEVRLARGGVRVIVADVADIQLRTVRRSTSTDPRVVVMRTSQSNGILRIVSVHPPPLSDVMHESLHFDEELGDFWHFDVTVDVELTMPARLALKVRTMRGDIDVSGVQGSVDVATNDGNIRLKKLGGALTAAAVGGVDLEIGPASNPGRAVQKVTAYSGDLRLRVPPGVRVRTTNGETVVAQGDATEVLRAAGSGTREVSVSIGELGAAIELGITRGRLIVMPMGASR